MIVDRRSLYARSIECCNHATRLCWSNCWVEFTFTTWYADNVVEVWYYIVNPDVQLIISFESLELVKCILIKGQLCHLCGSKLIGICLFVLSSFLLGIPLSFRFLMSLECVAFADLLLLMRVSAKSWRFPFLCQPIEFLVLEIDRLELCSMIVWVFHIHQVYNLSACIRLIQNGCVWLLIVIFHDTLSVGDVSMCGNIHRMNSRWLSLFSSRCLNCLWDINDFNVVWCKVSHRSGVSAACIVALP